MRKFRRVSLYITVFALLLVLLVSCSSTGTEKGFGKGKSSATQAADFLTGTRGVDLKFDDPGSLTVPTGEPAYFVLVAENLGTSPTILTFLVSGADKEYLNFDQPDESPTTLKGKSRYGKGDQMYYSFNSEEVKVPDKVKILNQPTTVNVCYDYETFVQIPVRINLRPEISKTIPSEYTVSASQGQGAPIGVTTLGVKSYRQSADMTRVVLDFNLAQLDKSNNAEVYPKTAEPCNAQLDPKQLQQLIVDKSNVEMVETEIILSNKNVKTCPALAARKGLVNLLRTPVVTCIFELERNEYPGDELNTVVTAKISYRMKHSLLKNVFIEDLDEGN